MELGIHNVNGSLVPYITELANTLFIGRRQTGKSTTLVNLALDLERFVFIGDQSTDEVLKRIPKALQSRVLYVNPARAPFALNFLADVPEEQRALYASVMLEAVKGVWGYQIPTPTLDQYLRGTVLTLLSVPNGNLIGAKLLLTDPEFRSKTIGHLTDPVLKDFWNDFESLTDKEQRTDTSSTLNKLRAVLFDPYVRDCIGQKHNKLSFKDKIVLVSLNESELGKDNARILGALILASIYIQGVKGLNTTVFIDDAHRYGGIVGEVLSCPSLTTLLATRTLEHYTPATRAGIIGGIEHLVAFRTTPSDGELLTQEFTLTNHHSPLSRIPFGEAYVQANERTVSLTLYPLRHDLTHQEGKITRRCKSQCTQPRDVIQKKIRRYFES